MKLSAFHIAGYNEYAVEGRSRFKKSRFVSLSTVQAQDSCPGRYGNSMVIVPYTALGLFLGTRKLDLLSKPSQGSG